MFIASVREKLESMRIDSDKYHKYLWDKFGSEVDVFCEVIKYFNTPITVGNHIHFNVFWESNYKNKPNDTELFNYAFDLYNNLKMFYEDGIYGLFKGKQAEWGAPEILITESDAPDNNDKNQLEDQQIIFRGLQQAEHKSKNYYQSWTIDKNKAIEFANNVYSDKSNGIVAQATVKKQDIIYYNSKDPEKEVIIIKGAIKYASKI